MSGRGRGSAPPQASRRGGEALGHGPGLGLARVRRLRGAAGGRRDRRGADRRRRTYTRQVGIRLSPSSTRSWIVPRIYVAGTSDARARLDCRVTGVPGRSFPQTSNDRNYDGCPCYGPDMFSHLRTSKSGHTCAVIVACAATAPRSHRRPRGPPSPTTPSRYGHRPARRPARSSRRTSRRWTTPTSKSFYLPDTTTVTVTTSNTTEKRGGAADRGRTIVSSLLRARKGKLPEPIVSTGRTVKPGDKASFTLSLLPGKYFIPVGRVSSTSPPLPNVPFKLQIGPVGSTTDSHEIFDARCAAAKRQLARVKSAASGSRRSTSPRRSTTARSRAEIVKLKTRLQTKRAKAHTVEEGRRSSSARSRRRRPEAALWPNGSELLTCRVRPKGRHRLPAVRFMGWHGHLKVRKIRR